MVSRRICQASALLALIVLALAIQWHFGIVLQDDTYISFRYAANLAAGHGLVYNPGERVEGYTNFLWTLLVAVGILVGIDPEITAVVCGSASLIGTLLVAWHIANRRFEGRAVAVAVPMLLAATPDFNIEAVAGLETAFFTLLLTSCLALTIHESQSRPGGVPWSAVTGGLAALTRPEGIMVYVLFQGVRLRQERTEAGRLRGLVLGWVIFATMVGSHLVFRILYYRDLLPNTFYAKTGGAVDQWMRGLLYLWGWVFYHPVLFLLSLIGGLLAVRCSRKEHPLFLTLAIPYLAYVIYVGGDYNPSFRFIHPFLPALCLLAAEAVYRLLRWPRIPAAVAAIALLAAFVTQTISEVRRYSRVAHDYYRSVWADGMVIADFIRERFPPNTVLGVYAAGVVPYVTGFRTYDTFGLTNAIAHERSSGMGKGFPGHEKLNEAFVLDRVDLFIPLGALKRKPAQVTLPVQKYQALFDLRVAPVPNPNDEAHPLWLHYFVRRR